MRPLAEQLFEYIKRRATIEGVAFELTVEFFERHLLCNPVFGVEHDGKELVGDQQEPFPGFFSSVREAILSGKKETAFKSLRGPELGLWRLSLTWSRKDHNQTLEN